MNVGKMNKQDKGGKEMSEVIYKKCPKCGAAMVRDDNVVYTSLPPQYRYTCPECGEVEIDTAPPRGFIPSEIPVSGSIRDWNTPFGPSISKYIPTESGTQKDLRPNFQDRKFLTEGLEDAANKYAILDEEGMWKDGGKYNGFIAGAEWQKSQMLKDAVEFECIGKKVKMTVQELINYYIDTECCDVADECGF